MNQNLFLLLFFFFAVGNIAKGQENLDSLAVVWARASFGQLYELLSIPNDAHYPDDIEQNVRWCEKAFASRGFSFKRLDTETVPLLLAALPHREGLPTVLAYLHLDGQPVEPANWFQQDPYQPVLKEAAPQGGWNEIPWSRLEGALNPEWRIFARSASDDKGPVMMFLAALDALRMMNKPLPYNLKVILDFEEELGSPQLPAAVERHREALAADVLLIFDGPRHISNLPTLSFGARGIADVTLTVYGPQFPQHSGHYGNYCPNPALRLAQLLAGMKDAQGRVTIPGFYDGVVIDEATRNILRAVPDDQRSILNKLGVAQPDAVAPTYQESLQYPSLNIRGLSAGWVGDEARTIIPATATAEIDVRLVLESDPERLMGLLRQYIEDQGYLVLNRAPDTRERLSYDRICRFDYRIAYKAFRTDINSPAGQWLSRAMVRAFGREPVKIRTSGGSIPISPFVATLNIPAVSVPTVNRDNNQHSPNENIRLGNYIDGVKTLLAIFTEPLQP